jgi:glycosyltransferase involved in cell wall biosynthesis
MATADAGAHSAPVTIIAHDIGRIGGMERQLNELVDGLLERGHHVTVVARVCVVRPHARLRWIRVPGPRRPFAIAYPWFLLLGSLLVALRRRGVVHSTGAIVFNRVDVCTVHFCHQAVAGRRGFSRASRSGLSYRLNSWVAGRLSPLGERLLYRPGRVGRLVGVSAGVTRELHAAFPLMRGRTIVIPNGVDTETFRPAEHCEPRTDGGLEALFVGSEWERKGLGQAIEALARCPGVRLTVVGEGDEASYRARAEALGVTDRLVFAGSRSDVASWYREADLFLLPTAYETFSLVTYEAAASGLPLLVGRVSGVEDILEDGVNGWFVDREPERIAERLGALRDDPGLRAEMGRRAREASLRFTWANVVRSYEELYSSVAR